MGSIVSKREVPAYWHGIRRCWQRKQDGRAASQRRFARTQAVQDLRRGGGLRRSRALKDADGILLLFRFLLLDGKGKK